MRSTVTVKGRATLSRPIRDHLGPKPGDRARFFVHPDGTVVMPPMLPASSLRGLLKRPAQKPVTVEEMDEAIAARERTD